SPQWSSPKLAAACVALENAVAQDTHFVDQQVAEQVRGFVAQGRGRVISSLHRRNMADRATYYREQHGAAGDRRRAIYSQRAGGLRRREKAHEVRKADGVAVHRNGIGVFEVGVIVRTGSYITDRRILHSAFAALIGE